MFCWIPIAIRTQCVWVNKWLNWYCQLNVRRVKEERKKKKRKREICKNERVKNTQRPEKYAVQTIYSFLSNEHRQNVQQFFFCLHTNTYFSGPCSFIAISLLSFFLLFQLNEHNHSHQQIQITRYHCCWKMDMIKVKIRGCKTSMYQILWKRKLNEVNKTDGMHDVFGHKKKEHI